MCAPPGGRRRARKRPLTELALPRLRTRRRRPLSHWARVCLAFTLLSLLVALLSWLRVFSGQWLVGFKAGGYLGQWDIFWSILCGLWFSWQAHSWWTSYRRERDRDGGA